MREYELVFILKPSLKEKDLKTEQAAVEKLIADLGGKVGKKDVWGKKDLTYAIKKDKQGFYFKFDLQLPEEKVGQWDKQVKLNENIIRYLLIRRSTA